MPHVQGAGERAKEPTQIAPWPTAHRRSLLPSLSLP